MAPTKPLQWRRCALLLLAAFFVARAAAAFATGEAADAKKPKAPKPPRVHVVALGGVRKVPYSSEGDPAGALSGESELKVRPLLVDGRVKDWTTGEPHDITDRSFAVRRALRLNDALPTDKGEHWVWQRGPWILVDRAAGHLVPIKLPDYDPSVSGVSWFRDYAAYCGLTSSGKQLYAVVAQVGARKPLIVKKLGTWDAAALHPAPPCAAAAWQREPLRITFQQTGAPPASFDLVSASAVLVEAGDADPPAQSAAPASP
jgi:hypothetical protein